MVLRVPFLETIEVSGNKSIAGPVILIEADLARAGGIHNSRRSQ
jgi:hypothetical protein